jgi:transcriptional regulator with XRE-family HTH domain
MHDVIAKGAAAARQRNGWTQEQAAWAYRAAGLASWRTSTVGSLEAGLRRPKLDEIVLMCAALRTTLADLIHAADEGGSALVTLGNGAIMTTGTVQRCLHSCGRRGVPDLLQVPASELAPPSEAERHAARRLGVPVDSVQCAAFARWGHGLDRERDARLGDIEEMNPRSRQARRGLVTRELLAELSRHTPERCRDT